MALYVDDQAMGMSSSALGPALEEAQAQLANQGRVIVEIHVDGQQISGEQIDQRAQDPVTDSVVRLYSAEPTQLALEVLEQVRTRLDEARALQEQASDQLQRDEQGQAMEKISQAIDGWLQTQQAVLQATGLLEIDLDEFTVNGEPMTNYTNQLLKQLEQLKSLIQQQDTVALADMLGYEWPELTDRWDRLINALIEHIEDGAG